MSKYPKVGRKLPELFEEIIRHDDDIDAFFASLDSVIPIQAARNWQGLKARKYELMRAAETYIKESKKDG